MRHDSVTTARIKRIFIANRGEIAVRVVRAARDLGIESVVPYSDPDAGAIPVRIGDRRVALGGSTAKDTYLHPEKLINAALQEGCDAVHPGYGFLAENAEFARAVTDAGLIFIGPAPGVIALMGDKHRAREAAITAGVPVVPGTAAGIGLDEMARFGRDVKYPLMAKAVAGGSGRGMRLIASESELKDRVSEAQSEAESAFGNGQVFLEKCILKPRHIEVQVMSDSHGNHLHLLERECTLQRRHQKVVEEAPAPRFHPELRRRMTDAAVELCRRVGYLGAGTIEFLVEGGDRPDSPFYFLEMNTRIQVEHTVTEEILGLDLVRLQIEIAAGQPIPFAQSDVRATRHALQFRIYAERTAESFRPLSGEVRYFLRPSGPGVREDSWVEAGTRISPYYDSLLSKIIITGQDRNEAIARAVRALRECTIEGLETTLPFHRWVLGTEAFLNCETHVKWIEETYRGEQGGRGATGPLVLPPPREAA